MIKKIYVPVIISAALVFVGCENSNQNKSIEGSKQESQASSLTYSNFNDHKTLQEVITLLKQQGIKNDSISVFTNSIKDYYLKMGPVKPNANGFASIQTQLVPYNEDKLSKKWNSLELPYFDVNCRITSFRLFEQFVTSESEFTGDNIDLIFDLEETINKNPYAKFNDQEVKAFDNLFSAIPTEQTTNVKIHADNITKEWQEREISFTENKSISMINIFLHYPETKNVFIGHSGVLIKEKDGYMFIEKYGPALPYQASKFQTKKELYKYLMKRFDTSSGEAAKESSKPIIMENNQLLSDTI
ncbi:DUF4300 family protein [Bacillus massiliigorillae]|uniref:DUF4300 family protein n=1 Tax=Bacillus massiliigorillae TaxID=1243664 RepID=UPI0003A1E8D4|nr:DUF4300 family protein [Bacillus massiliigorillae]